MSSNANKYLLSNISKNLGIERKCELLRTFKNNLYTLLIFNQKLFDGSNMRFDIQGEK